MNEGRKKMFPNATDEQWNDWKWQVKNRIETLDELKNIIDNVSDKEVVLKSASSSLDFALTGAMNPLNENQTEVQLLFEGKFNPFIKMMVEKPLQNFINSLTDKIEQL